MNQPFQLAGYVSSEVQLICDLEQQPEPTWYAKFSFIMLFALVHFDVQRDLYYAGLFVMLVAQ